MSEATTTGDTIQERLYAVGATMRLNGFHLEKSKVNTLGHLGKIITETEASARVLRRIYDDWERTKR